MEDQYTSGCTPSARSRSCAGRARTLWDADGNEYIDCVGGQGAANIGHANPQVAQAIAAQAATLISCPEMFYNDRRAALEAEAVRAERLPARFPVQLGHRGRRSGAQVCPPATGRTGIIATMRGFHGRTMGALSATWEKKYREPFEPLVPGFSHVPYNNLEALQRGGERQHRRGDPGSGAGRRRRDPRPGGIPARRAGALPRTRRAADHR